MAPAADGSSTVGNIRSDRIGIDRLESGTRVGGFRGEKNSLDTASKQPTVEPLRHRQRAGPPSRNRKTFLLAARPGVWLAAPSQISNKSSAKPIDFQIYLPHR
jgi:hypothetical protein